jgi:hypothetical protein
MTPPAITAKQVSDLLRASFKLGPWPDESACDRLAAELARHRQTPNANQTPAAPSASNRARKAAIDLQKALPKRRQFWADAKPITSPCEADNGEAAEIPGAKWIEDAERALVALEKALQDAMPFIDFPPLAVTKQRRKPEHIAIFHIATVTIEALRKAGRQELSIDPPSPLVDFVVQALDRLGWAPPPHATVATALRRIPAMKWVRQQWRSPLKQKDSH